MLQRHLTITRNTKPSLLKDDVYVTPDSRIVDVDGEPIALEFSDTGEALIELDWFDGRRKYAASLLVLHVFKPVHIHLKYWTYIKALYLDSKQDNFHIDNLYWWFPPRTLEYKKMPGFYFIPGATRNVINENGDVYCIYMQKWLAAHDKVTGSPSLGYYVSISLKHDDNNHHQMRRHRLVAMTFLGYDAETIFMHVNHRDGVPGRDHADNLEWATPRENNRHAMESGLSPLKWRFDIYNTVNDERQYQLTFSDLFARGLLISAEVCITLFKETTVAVVGDWMISRVKAPKHGPKVKKIYEVLDTKTGVVETFTVKRRLGDKFRIGDGALNAVLSKGPTVLLPGKLLLRTVGKDEWPEDCSSLPVYEFGDRSVTVRKLPSREVLIFKRVIEAATYLGISPDAMNYRLSDDNEQRIWPDMTQCQYTEELTEWRDSDDPGREIAADAWKKAVDVRNVRTGEITRYDSRREAARAVGVVEAVVSTFLSKDEITTIRKGFQFKLAIDDRPWPVIDDVVAELAFANNQRPVVAINTVTKEERFYQSSNECALAFKVPASNLSYWLKKFTTASLEGGWQITFYAPQASTKAWERRRQQIEQVSAS